MPYKAVVNTLLGYAKTIRALPGEKIEVDEYTDDKSEAFVFRNALYAKDVERSQAYFDGKIELEDQT
ncbi:MAG TPA: hypothetical protein K8V56_16090 [Sporosarcina psychrophila]|uniref:Uncharacterized protein n=1 Tax=Sporosarcina psychrophila TaxID=1476 RepID=A0A921KEI0_SPOPS|nr:hypothetical protein [Sporosarcina psychrophila]